MLDIPQNETKKIKADRVNLRLSSKLKQDLENFCNDKKINSTYADLPFEFRIAKIYAECKEVVKGIDIMDMRGIAMHQFLRNSNLLDEPLVAGPLRPS